MLEQMLGSWRDGATRAAILSFVRSVSQGGPDFVPPADRIATFDNDGTLWCEKPIPIQLDFILRRLEAMAEEQPSCANDNRGEQPTNVTTHG